MIFIFIDTFSFNLIQLQDLQIFQQNQIWLNFKRLTAE